ncbi:APC family permease [Streptomyces broussonetiae]|uniref:APC family permease n=1 Tax=Streptomyces broussonetiae TaxID=2686304 RepID=UPI0035E1B000
MPPASPAPSPPRPSAPARRLSTGHIVFLIVAAAAPLSAMVGTVPLAFAVGTGPGVPAAFVFAGLTLLCFSVGYAVSARRTQGRGGFYGFIADGLGRTPAVASGFVALLSYTCATIGLVGATAYFTRLVLADHGMNVPWPWCAAAALAVVAFLSHREIAISARLLAVLMLAETGILFVLDCAVLWRHGTHALPTASFTPHHALGSGLGVSIMFAFVSFIGFESAALYGQEARDPRRSVPRATYVAVALIAGFYSLTSWIAVGAVGPDHLRATAQQLQGNLFFALGQDYLGTTGTVTMQILLCTSLLAATLALHSAAGRYAQTLAADALLPAVLARPHPRHRSPYLACLAITVVATAVTAVFAVLHLDVYSDMTTSMLGLGTLGIIALQALAAASVLRLRHDRPARLWSERLVPLLGFAGLVTSVWLAVHNFALLSGSADPLVAKLPWLLLITAAGAGAWALWLRRARPERYRALPAVLHHGPADATEAVAPEPSRTAAPAEHIG